MIWDGITVRSVGRLLIDLFLAYVRFCRWQAYGKWQGRYFEFQGQQVRICLADEVVWFSEADIFILLDPAPTRLELVALAEQRGTIPGHTLPGITETGALRLLDLRTNHRRTSRDMLLLRRWLTHEVIPNIRRNPSGSM
jgi:prophage antirepressor-like protein